MKLKPLLTHDLQNLLFLLLCLLSLWPPTESLNSVQLYSMRHSRVGFFLIGLAYRPKSESVMPSSDAASTKSLDLKSMGWENTPQHLNACKNLVNGGQVHLRI